LGQPLRAAKVLIGAFELAFPAGEEAPAAEARWGLLHDALKEARAQDASGAAEALKELEPRLTQAPPGLQAKFAELKGGS
ncbi:MAG: hypothetical protein KDD82_02490, partial [Planctomycetes bacterium]|nr:hypothetical protein [Planctomycetota bacterium]